MRGGRVPNDIMSKRPRLCEYDYPNGECCDAFAMKNSDMCYWHHKARLRERNREKIGGTASAQANTGIEVPLLEDANAIQVGIQEVIHALLDRRVDEKRAGLILYGLQLASSNMERVKPQPWDGARQAIWVPYEEWQEEHDRLNRKPRRKLHLLPKTVQEQPSDAPAATTQSAGDSESARATP